MRAHLLKVYKRSSSYVFMLYIAARAGYFSVWKFLHTTVLQNQKSKVQLFVSELGHVWAAKENSS